MIPPYHPGLVLTNFKWIFVRPYANGFIFTSIFYFAKLNIVSPVCFTLEMS